MNDRLLDYGIGGFGRHLAVMQQCGVIFAGVGEDAAEAVGPTILDTGRGRVASVAPSLGSGWAVDVGNSVPAGPAVNALGF
ncbi:MAG: CapA family protein [Gemmatimonadales bacterium]